MYKYTTTWKNVIFHNNEKELAVEDSENLLRNSLQLMQTPQKEGKKEGKKERNKYRIEERIHLN